MAIQGDMSRLIQETRGWHWMTSYGSYLCETEYAVRKLAIDWRGVS